MPEAEIVKKITEFEDKSLLIVDDDNPFRERLARAMEKKGFLVSPVSYTHLTLPTSSWV